MPPKAKSSAPSKKTELKKKEKVIEDKTFGLKNKKGAKQQKFIQQVQHQVKHGGAPARKVDDQKKTEVAKKEEKKKEQAELNQLFKPVLMQKVEKGADPKSVLCAFFKQGLCAKGDKCKFSHDLQIERKAEKRSAYVDLRDEKDDGEISEDADGKGTKTKIICKFFLDALETNKFGWFWDCPNGEKCVYRHALPAGYVLEKDKKKDDKKEEISIEDLVERERAALGDELTRVTLETFLAWKKKKILERKALLKKDEARRKADFKAGRSVGISGREMFMFRPELAIDDEMEDEEVAYDTSNLPRDGDDDDQEEEPQNVRELTLESVASVAQEVDNSGTQATSLNRMQQKATPSSETMEGAIGGSDQTNGEINVIPIDENLFMDDSDLDDLDEELEDMHLKEENED